MNGNSEIVIGRYTYGHRQMQVHQWGEGARLQVGAFCSIAAGVQIMLGGNHRVDWITTFPFGHIFEDELGGSGIVGHPQTKGDVVIGNDVWLSRDATILSGVTIGDGAVVAAKSVVTKSIGPYEIWGGNPAKFLKMRFDAATVAALLALQWWELPIEHIRAIAPLLSTAPGPDTFAAIQAELAAFGQAADL